jgi:hypothetical protein
MEYFLIGNQMTPRKFYEILYALNFGLLFTHEIDSAYWREWNLFGIPGGIQFFLLVNFALFIAAIFGYSQLLKLKQSGYWFSLLLAAAGVFSFTIHTFFIFMGHSEFTLLGSELLLGIILLVSIAQAILIVRVLIKK